MALPQEQDTAGARHQECMHGIRGECKVYGAHAPSAQGDADREVVTVAQQQQQKKKTSMTNEQRRTRSITHNPYPRTTTCTRLRTHPPVSEAKPRGCQGCCWTAAQVCPATANVETGVVVAHRQPTQLHSRRPRHAACWCMMCVAATSKSQTWTQGMRCWGRWLDVSAAAGADAAVAAGVV
eukprot:1062689-Pelagomonas_calceolata.AAC.2